MPGGSPGYAAVVFDCDSTLAAVEGIDELAGPLIDRVRDLTDRAMDGTVPLEEVYGERLALIQPTKEQVDALGRRYVAALLPDARETIDALRWLGKSVRVVSGGLRGPVIDAARALGLSEEDVAAVDVEFDDDGRYLGFDRGSPLARAGGKAEVIRGWRLPRPVLLVGDGATDLEARPAVDAFAAFMGVVDRPRVADGADFVLREPLLAPVLAIATSEAERERLRDSVWADLLDRGCRLGPSGHLPRARDL